MIKPQELYKVLDSFYDKNKIIRNPLVTIEGEYLKIIHDSYTSVKNVSLYYYCQPYAFNVINYDDSNELPGAVHSCCSLPFQCFDELIQGAIGLYVNYRSNVDINKSNAQRQALNSLVGNDKSKEGEQ